MAALTLPFADVEETTDAGCTIAHIQALAGFLAAHRGERVLIHCTAGLGRSPALAVVALVLDGMEPEAACMAVARAVPEASPNRLVLIRAELSLNLPRGTLTGPCSRLFAYQRGAHGAVGRRTQLRVIEAPPQWVLPGRENPRGHLAARGANAHRISGGTHQEDSHG